MIFVTVDNDSGSLRELSGRIFKKYPGSVVYEFTDPMMSVKYICNHDVDMVLAKEKMRPVNGTKFTDVVRVHKPTLPIIILKEEK